MNLHADCVVIWARTAT